MDERILEGFSALHNFKCHSPKYATPQGCKIDLIWDHKDFGEIPFTACGEDGERHGRVIYRLAKEGVYGEIAPYEGKSLEELEADNVRYVRAQLLGELDTVVSNPIRWATLTPENQQELIDYRLALLDLTEQDGFPFEVTYPDKPNPL